jgi:hypothetical protein
MSLNLASPPAFPTSGSPFTQDIRLFFDCAAKLAPIVSDMIRASVEGHRLQIVGRMVAAAASSYAALLTPVLNGYGQGAVKIAAAFTSVNIFLPQLTSSTF